MSYIIRIKHWLKLRLTFFGGSDCLAKENFIKCLYWSIKNESEKINDHPTWVCYIIRQCIKKTLLSNID